MVQSTAKQHITIYALMGGKTKTTTIIYTGVLSVLYNIVPLGHHIAMNTDRVLE